jgi:hypothetical protein
MSENVLCGRCGTRLDGPRAACRSCGARSTGFAQRQPGKSPWLAAALAVVPGLGHLYLGEWWKAAFVLAGLGGLEFIGVDLDLTLIGAELGLPIGAGGFGLWAFSIWDAYRIAKSRQTFQQPGFNTTP